MSKEYLEFLEKKKHSIGNFGFKANYIPDIAFDFQEFIIKKSILNMKEATKRFKVSLEKQGLIDFTNEASV